MNRGIGMNWTVGIDLGAQGARMSTKGRALVLRQSSACALAGEQILALGDEARRMEGRAPRKVEVLYPMASGSVGSERALRAWLRHMAQHSGTRSVRMLIARPPQMSLSQMRHLSALALESGASACGLVRSDLAAALGAGLTLEDKKGALVVQVGAGSVSVTLMAALRTAVLYTLPYGVDRADQAVQRLLRGKGLSVGPVTAESVKVSLASVMTGASLEEPVAGLDVQTGFPGQRTVAAAEVAQCLSPITGPIPELVCRALDQATPELLEDLIDRGILLTGGGSQVYGLDKQIAEATGLSCRVAEDPAGCVARGLEKLLDASDDFQFLVQAHQTLLEKRLAGPLGGRA